VSADEYLAMKAVSNWSASTTSEVVTEVVVSSRNEGARKDDDDDDNSFLFLLVFLSFVVALSLSTVDSTADSSCAM